MKSLILLMAIAAMAFSGDISQRLLEEMGSSDPAELHYVLVKPVGSADTDYINLVTQGMTRDERRVTAASIMKDLAAETQVGILTLLSGYSTADVQEIHPHWIVNGVSARLSSRVIQELAEREDVLFIRLMNIENALIEPVEIRHESSSGSSKDIAWGVSQIGAPDVWALGYDGSGVVVSVIDTGVNYNHVDLHNNMWHDTGAGYHYGWDFADNDNDPMDEYGHGTHCAGSVAGDGAAGTETGVAPGATIMALRVANQLSAESQIWDALEFSIDYGADVISTSMGWCQAWDPDRFTWREAEENVLAAGICHSVAAGNESGSTGNWGDIRTPGDCPPPWLHPEQTTTGGLSAVVTVGATDNSDNIAGFSSVGFSTWVYDDPWFDYGYTSPDIGLIDPDIVGPGVDIVSCSYSNNMGYTTMSGTSMATPHLAGCMALMLNANPNLSPAQIDSLLEVTALDLGDTGKDNVYGSGRVQVLEAVEAALEVGIAHDEQQPSVEGLILSSSGSNPVGSILVFDLYARQNADMRITVYDISGHAVETVHSGELESGNHSFTWGVPDNVANGLYFLVARSPMGSATLRFTVLR